MNGDRIDGTVTVIGMSPMTAVILPLADTIETDDVGNVTLSWDNPFNVVTGKNARAYLADLAPYLSQRVQQQTTRGGYWLCIADPGARPCLVRWLEINPWTATSTVRQMHCLVTLATRRDSWKDQGFRLVLLRANRLRARGTGATFTFPAL